MINKFRILFVSALAVVSMSAGAVVVNSGLASAVDPKAQVCKGSGGTWTGRACNYPTGINNDLGSFIADIVNVLLFIVGAVAVIMLIVGGLRYVLSGGDSSQTKAAKDTILYAIIGIVVATAAYAIVNFVVLNV